MKHSIDCVGFKPLRKGTLVGFADIVISELRIHGVTLHEKGRVPLGPAAKLPQG